MIKIHYDRRDTAPPVLAPEFQDIRRYSLRNSHRFLAKIGPGDYYATANNELITTTLGSCVAACIRNLATGVGGMNHFMLPDSSEGSSDSWEATLVSTPARYGNVAMERLINVVLGENLDRGKLEIKVFGGAKVLAANIDVGDRNVRFIKSYVRKEGMKLAADDLGGTAPRKVVYDPQSGDVFVRLLGSGFRDRIVKEEMQHMAHIKEDSAGGDVDLFTSDGWSDL
jgi:chemotaxis protein CheD